MGDFLDIGLYGINLLKDVNQGISIYGSNLYNYLVNNNYNVKLYDKVSLNGPSLVFKSQLYMGLDILSSNCNIHHLIAPEFSPVLSRVRRNTVLTVHDLIPYILNERKNSFNLYYKIALNSVVNSDRIICVSNSTKFDLLKYFDIDESKISVIHHGINNNKFFPKGNKDINYSNRIKKIGYLGGLGKRKNVEYLITAFSKYLNQLKNKDVRLIIGGNGKQRIFLEGLVKELNISKYVEFRGFIPSEKQNDFYNELDLFVFPSLYEGFGLPVLESMSSGTPTIVSNVSSMPEIIGSKKYLFELDNIDSLVDKIDSMLSKKYENRYFLERSKNFSLEKSFSSHISVYKDLVI